MKNYSLFIVVCFLFFCACEKGVIDVENASDSTSEAFIVEKQTVVFIAGFDEGDNRYYSKAKEHFQHKKMKIVEGLFSAEEIIDWLNSNHNEAGYDEIHIVSHSNAWRGMSLLTTKDGKRISQKTLSKISEQNSLPKVKKGISNTTKIIFHSCGLGGNTGLLQSLKIIFSSENSPRVYAATYFNIFGGKYASHYLAKPYYVFYPTAESKGPMALSEEIQKSYPKENIDWFNALKTREETMLGSVYSYRFNIPVSWELTFDDKLEIPHLNNSDDIMDWVSDNDEIAIALYELGIPIEKFRWISRVTDNTLKIEGKTTVLCVLKPIMNPGDASEYLSPTLDNTTIYSSF